MIRRPPRSTRTDTLLPYTTLVRSLGQPQVERGLAPPRSETFDPVPQFGKRHDAQVKLLFVDRGEPVHHAGIGTRLCPFGNDIGIEQEAHSAVSRTPPSSRSTESPEPRSEERRVGNECVSTCRSRGSTYH